MTFGFLVRVKEWTVAQVKRKDQVKRKIRKLVNTCWVEGAQWKWQVVRV